MAAPGSLLQKAASTRDLVPNDPELWDRIVADGQISPEEMTQLCALLLDDLRSLERQVPDALVADLHRILSRYEMILAALRFSLQSTLTLFEAFSKSAKP